MVRKILLAIGVALLISASFPPFALAQEEDTTKLIVDCGINPLCVMEKVFTWISITLAQTAGAVSAFAITLIVGFIQTLIELSRDLTSTPMVTLGFRLTLSLANLGFVLAIIIIAFATILRIQSYAMKQLLWKLVVAALLVNFSFALAGTIIDFTNVLGNFFIAKASPGEDIAKFGDKLAASMNIQKLTLLSIDGGKDLANGLKFGEAYIKMFISIAIVLIFNSFIVLTFAAVAFMMLVRHVFMIVLLILMPLAWLFWIFPGTATHWTKWWSNFLKWALFLPAMTFFMFLSITSFEAMQQAVSQSTTLFKVNSAAETAAGFLVFDKSGILVFLQIVVQGGLLLGGLMVAQNMSITGANAFMGAAKGSANWIKGKVWRTTGVPYLGRAAARGGAAVLSNKWLRWIPGAKNLAGTLSTAGSRKQEVDYYKKRFDKLEGAAREQAFSGPLSLNSAENTAMLRAAVETKQLKSVLKGKSDKQLLKLAKDVQANDPKLIKEIQDVRPDLAGAFAGKTGDDARKKVREASAGIRADKWQDVDMEAYKSSEFGEAVLEGMGEPGLSAIRRSASTEMSALVEKRLRKMANIGESTQNALLENEKKMVDILEEIAEAKERGDAKTLQAAQARIGGLRAIHRGLYTPANDNERRAYEKLLSLRQRTNNPNIT